MDHERIWRFSLGFLFLLAGCSSMNLGSSFPFIEEKPQQPVKIVAIWRDTAIGQPNELPKRGFLGRLVFYGKKQEKPIRVDGKLMVYAFEEGGNGLEKVKPDREFLFAPEQFATHYAKCELGNAYAIWLPWDTVGGPEKEISLIARFVPNDGSMVISEQSRHFLPGEKVVPNPGAAPPRDPGYAAANMQAACGPHRTSRRFWPE